VSRPKPDNNPTVSEPQGQGMTTPSIRVAPQRSGPAWDNWKHERHDGESRDGIEMKKLIFIGGPIGVGKTAVARALNEQLESSVMLDGDWCWQMHPWVINAENKSMVISNIQHLLQAYIDNTGFATIIFSWVMHEQQIIDDICTGLTMDKVCFTSISLITDDATLRRNFESDGRDIEALPDSLARLSNYKNVRSIKIETMGKTAEDLAHEIAVMIA